MAKHRRKFEGIWIPKELWFSKKMTLLEKMLLIEINSLNATEKGCFASNKHFAELFGLSRKYVSQVINDMIQRKWLNSTIDKAAGNRRYLIPLSDYRRIGCPAGVGEPIPPQQDTPIQPQQEHNNNKPNTNSEYEQLKTTDDFSSEEILELDLEINEKRLLFMSEIERILKPDRRSATTFVSIMKYLIEECQCRRLKPSIFTDAIRWAKEAAESRTARNPAGLFVSKIKSKTGFKKQKLLLV